MQVVRKGALYLASSLVTKLVPFLLLPLLTSYLAPAEFGMVSIFVGINGLVASTVGMAMHTNIASNFYADAHGEMALLVGNVVMILAATATLALLVLAIVAAAEPVVFSLDSSYLLLMPLLAFMAMLGTLNTTILRNEGKVYEYAGFECGHMLVNVSVSVGLLVWSDLGWRAMVVGMLAAETVFSLIAAWRLRRKGYLALRFDAGKCRGILRLSLPLVPHALGGVVIAVSDRLFIEAMVGIEAVALYSIGYSFGMAMGLVTDAAMKAWTPWVYRTLAAPTDAGKRRVVQSCYALVALFLGAAAAVAVAAEFLLSLMVAEEYRGAAAFVAWVTLAYAVRGIYQVFFPFLVHVRRTAFLAFSTVLAALVNLVLNYVLIGAYGAIGGAYATVIAFATSAALVFWYQRRNYDMPWFGATR